MANHTFVNYKCNDGFAHKNGSLNGTCHCTNISEGRCVSKPEWHFDDEKPFCTGMYLIFALDSLMTVFTDCFGWSMSNAIMDY